MGAAVISLKLDKLNQEQPVYALVFEEAFTYWDDKFVLRCSQHVS